MNIITNASHLIINKGGAIANYNNPIANGKTLNITGGLGGTNHNEESKLDIASIIKKDGNLNPHRTINDFKVGQSGPLNPKSKVSQQYLEIMIKKMFNNEDASRFASSEFEQHSIWDDRSISAIVDTNQEKCRQFLENYEIVEPISIGA